jgi:hypothetical protein
MVSLDGSVRSQLRKVMRGQNKNVLAVESPVFLAFTSIAKNARVGADSERELKTPTPNSMRARRSASGRDNPERSRSSARS